MFHETVDVQDYVCSEIFHFGQRLIKNVYLLCEAMRLREREVEQREKLMDRAERERREGGRQGQRERESKEGRERRGRERERESGEGEIGEREREMTSKEHKIIQRVDYEAM